MDNNKAIIVNNLSKIYKIYNKPSDRIKELLSFNAKKLHNDFKALDDVSFDLIKGDRLGIVGENGSGKSTLLKILSNVLTPSSGTVFVDGKVTSLLELGTGFNPELSGKENVYQNGMICGYAKEDMHERYDKIHEFSEIGDFIHQPLKTYSSGMMLRLAFGCSVFVDPDILIVDEALSVGDYYFQNKCFYKIKHLIDNGVTFIYVTHNPDSVKTLCNKGIMLDHGKIIREGPSDVVSNYYIKTLYEKQNKSTWYMNESVHAGEEEPISQQTDPQIGNSDEKEPIIPFKVSEVYEKRVSSLRTGTGAARIKNIELLNSKGEATDQVYHGDELTIRVYFETYEKMPKNCDLGVGIHDDKDLEIIQFTASDEGLVLEGLEAGEKVIVDFMFVNILKPGRYNLTSGLSILSKTNITKPYHFTELVLDNCVAGVVFEVSRIMKKAVYGKVSVPVKVKRLQKALM